MDIYLVGGAVRDALMAQATAGTAGMAAPPQEPADRDWVVVGSTPQAMLDQGYLPVGRDFPVFLHPTTREEYALARTERKTAPGYHGFAFHTERSVTLQEDLARRDLTINAMAVAANDAQRVAIAPVIDPHGGQRDLQQRVLRHVTAAFSEDPVRILRLARFAARFADFSVAPETLALMRHMVAAGEVDHLVPERVWQELSRGLMQQRPSRLLDVLRECGALARLLPELEQAWQAGALGPAPSLGDHVLRALDTSARLQAPLEARFACLCLGLASDVQNEHQTQAPALHAVCDRWRVPRECRELAQVVAQERNALHGSLLLDAQALVQLLERCDALRRPQRFAQVLLACECDALAQRGNTQHSYPPRNHLSQTLAWAQSVDTATVARAAQQAGLAGEHIAAAVQQARVQVVAQGLARAAAKTSG